MAKKSSYEIITTELSKDPFAFLDNYSVKDKKAVGFRARNPYRAAQMYNYLKQTTPSILGHTFSEHMIKTLCVIIDHETGYRRVRENGFPFNDVGRAYVIKHSMYLAGKVGNGPSQGKATTMETDYVKFRGTFWIQLTGAGNFKATGDTAYNLRRRYPQVNPGLKALMDKWPTLSGMPSVCIDLMAMDPLMNVLVLLTFLSRTGKKKELALSDRVNILNDTTTTEALMLIGYDNDPKPAVWGNVPSLNDMVHRAVNFQLTTSNNIKNEKDKINTRSRTQDSRRLKFTRSAWS